MSAASEPRNLATDSLGLGLLPGTMFLVLMYLTFLVNSLYTQKTLTSLWPYLSNFISSRAPLRVHVSLADGRLYLNFISILRSYLETFM